MNAIEIIQAEVDIIKDDPAFRKPEDMLAAAQALIIFQPQEFPGFWHPDWQERFKQGMQPSRMLAIAAALLAKAISDTKDEHF